MLGVFLRSFGPIFWFDGPLVNSVGLFCMADLEFFFWSPFQSVLKVVFLGLELLLNCSISMKLCVRDYIKQTRLILLSFKYPQGEDRRIVSLVSSSPSFSHTHTHSHTLLFVREFYKVFLFLLLTLVITTILVKCDTNWPTFSKIYDPSSTLIETLVYILFYNQKYMDRDIRILFEKTWIALRCWKNCLWKTIKFCIYFRVLQTWTLKLCKTLVFVPRRGGGV